MAELADEIRNGEREEKEGGTWGREMSFLDHLEELRWRVVKAAIGVVACAILCMVFIDVIMAQVLLPPAKKVGIHLINLKPFGKVMLYFQVAIIAGIVASIPNILYQLWKFIAPGLMPRERKYISSIVAFSSLCFLSGIVFAYFVMLPVAFQFAAGFGTPDIENTWAINEYMSFIVSVMLAAGIVFELPMVSWFLSKLGILTPAFMRHYRRHAIVVIFILSAILSPGTDPSLQLMLAVPLILLYQLSIWISKFAQKKTS
jgi:sec-independent protein translocase protein TatC